MTIEVTADVEASLIKEMVSQIDSGAVMDAPRLQEVLQTLEKFECWAPYFRLLHHVLANPRIRTIAHYVRLARVKSLYLDEAADAAHICGRLVNDLKIGFVTIRDEVVPKVIEEEDFTSEALIWEQCLGSLTDQSDKVSCLERLCLIYEKKTHNEALLGTTYERLLQLDPQNIKALRYFKLAFSQNNEWAEVVNVLKTLLGSVRHPQEIFRYGQELAAVNLYQLENPAEAVKALEKYCADSPLDTSTIHYDAYQKMGDIEGCLRVLRGCLLNVEDETSRAVLHHKIASLHEFLGQLEAAMENYQKSVELSSTFLDPVEGMISTAIALKKWEVALGSMRTLIERVEDEESKAQLRQAIRRLENGMEHAAK